jgi:hypothetical protein
MKEFDVALKAVVDGLRSIAQGVEKLAEKLEESTPKKQAKSKPPRKTAVKPKKAAPKIAPVKKALKETAANSVLKIIAGSKKGINSATLMKKTGFDRKKIANIVFKLRKQGKIKSVDKGVYTKV